MYHNNNKLTNTLYTLICKQFINNVKMDTFEGKVHLKFKTNIKAINPNRLDKNNIHWKDYVKYYQCL